MSFPRHKHHICLVSEQTLPNYLGAIVPGAFPETLHLVVTSRMKERADILEKALQHRGYVVERYPLAATQPNEMMEVMESIYAKTGPDVAINVTGGTKIMALAAVDWAGIQDEHPFLFYVDTDNKKILQIGGRQEQFDMTTALKLKELLKAGAGVDINAPDGINLSSAERDILDRLAQTFLKNKNALGLFNKCAKEAEHTLYADMPYAKLSEFKSAIAIAQEAGKLHTTSNKINYESEKARFWCNGGWLEEFVKARLYRMKSLGLIDDWACNVKIFNEQKTAEKNIRYAPDRQNEQNELDAAFTAANRFFVIECKTANLAKRDGFSQASYKLDTLRRSLGGVLSRGMIISVFDPRPVDIRRCKDLRIELLYGADALKLEEKLKTWIQNVNR